MVRGAIRLQRGLTLIEISLVILIIAILMGILIPRVVGAGDKAKVNMAKIVISQVKQRIEEFRISFNALPKNIDELVSCAGQQSGCIPVANEKEIVDPWGEKLRLNVKDGGRAYTLKSLGADRAEGGEGVNADIVEEGP